MGLEPGATHDILDRLAGEVRDGRNLVIGELICWPDWPELRITVEALPDPGDVVLVANRFYQRPVEYSVPAYQLTWALPGHGFPWEDRGPAGPDVQPRPGRWRA